jgi:hypothetical protein
LNLEPLGKDANDAYNGFVENVLGNGTKVTLSVTDTQGDGSWTVERSVKGSTVVKHNGVIVEASPLSLIGYVEFFGQHEVAELAKLPEARANLLTRFIPAAATSGRTEQEIVEDLRQNRVDIAAEMKARKRLSKGQDQLPILTEQLRVLDEGGVRSRLDVQTRFVKEEPLLEEVTDLVGNLAEQVDALEEIDLSFLDDEAIKDFPTRDGFVEVREALVALSGEWVSAKERLVERLAEVARALDLANESRATEMSASQEKYMELLRQLQAESIDGAKIVNLETQKATLESNLNKLEESEKREKQLRTRRMARIKEWEKFRRREFEKLKVAAEKVSKELYPTVRVTCRFEGNRSKLEKLLRDRLGGQLHVVVSSIEKLDDSFDATVLARACRKGESAVSALLGIEGAQVRNVADLDEEVLMEMEELWLGPITNIDLRVGRDEDGKPVWRGLQNLSTGEKATAILLILLLGSEESIPLVIDQAEDDLDNGFIADGIVPKLRDEKFRRQFILSTHNPNIPVLGDAEQVVRLTPEGEAATGGRAVAKSEHMGSLDRPSVRREVESLEGGREAFETRRRRYGY